MLLWIALAVFIMSLFLCANLLHIVTRRHKWIIPYIRKSDRKLTDTDYPVNIYFSICDHFQPFWGFVSQEIAEHRVVTWQKEFTHHARKHSDCRGHHPVHTFFYSEEDYNPHFTDELSKLVREKIADVELLISYPNNIRPDFRRRIEEFRDVLFHHHGLLRKNGSGKIIYGFVHGYSALNKSQNDGEFTGTTNGIPVLKETGCYADYTYPSPGDVTQPPFINSIYFFCDQPGTSRPHESGYPASKNVWSENELLFIQGPLTLNWNRRVWGIFPRIENGSINHLNRFSADRADLWVNKGVRINGLKNHIFIKLFTHGAQDHTIRYFFGENGLDQLWSFMEKNYNNDQYKLYYVSAFDMYRIIKNLCTGAAVISNSERSV